MANLLHISANVYPSLDGKDHHTKNIWKELAKGFDTYHILARSEDNHYRCSQEGNIYLHLVPRITEKSKIFFLTSFWMFYLIKKYNITHLLSQCPIVGGYTASLASRFFNIPLMVELHGEEYFRFLKKRTFLYKIFSSIMMKTIAQAKKIRSLNEEMTQKLYAEDIVENVVIIPNRVNLEIFNKTKMDYAVHHPLKLISVGRFVPEKDYLNLIKNLHHSNMDFHLTLIGGGKLKDIYMKYIHKYELQKKVKLIDWIEQKDMIDLLVESDIYIQSSMSEGMPRTIVEAMALKLPIISTEVGSIKGVLKDRHNAILIKENSQKQIKDTIDLLVGDEALRMKIADQAFKDVLEKYEWNKIFELYRYELKNM